jgi:hypothetical protein
MKMTSPKRLSSATREAQVPKGPKGQKRPPDVIGNAIRVAKIATGEFIRCGGGAEGLIGTLLEASLFPLRPRRLFAKAVG